jgi:hypothetical protein
MAEYDPPIYDVSIFNPAYFIVEDGITKSYLNANYLQFPVGQDLETLPDLRVENTNIHLGTDAGLNTQGDFAISIGNSAGKNNQSVRGVAIGDFAGSVSQGNSSVALGNYAGNDNQSSGAVAIGIQAGQNSQGANSVAIGSYAGYSGGNLGANSVAIGNAARATGTNSVSVGHNASTSTYTNSVAIGNGTTCSSSNQLRIGTNNTAYQMEGRLNLVNSTNKSLISFGNAVKMYRYNNGLTIGNYGDFNIRVSDFTAEPTSVPSSQAGFEGLWITSTGRAYLGSGVSVHLRSVLGEVYITGYTTAGNVSTIGTSGQLSVSSDRRLKENIETYDEPSIDKIMKLKPSYYNWIEGTDKRKELGFIAQDVEDIIPEAVDGKKYEYEWEKDKEGKPILDASGNLQFTDTPRYRGLLDRPIIAVLVKAVQELKMEIEALKNQ